MENNNEIYAILTESVFSFVENNQYYNAYDYFNYVVYKKNKILFKKTKNKSKNIIPRKLLIVKDSNLNLYEAITGLPIKTFNNDIFSQIISTPVFIVYDSTENINSLLRKIDNKTLLEYYEDIDLDKFSKLYNDFYQKALIQMNYHNKYVIEIKEADDKKKEKGKELLKRINEYRINNNKSK